MRCGGRAAPTAGTPRCPPGRRAAHVRSLRPMAEAIAGRLPPEARSPRRVECTHRARTHSGCRMARARAHLTNPPRPGGAERTSTNRATRGVGAWLYVCGALRSARLLLGVHRGGPPACPCEADHAPAQARDAPRDALCELAEREVVGVHAR